MREIAGLLLVAVVLGAATSCADDAGGQSDAATDSSTDADVDSDTDSDGDSDDCVHPDVLEICSGGWCEIPAGCYTFGSFPSEPCRDEYSDQQFEVTLTRSFLMQQTEVTQAEWEAAGFPNPSKGTVAPDVPVFFVNYFEAMAYANFLSTSEGYDTCYDLSACEATIGSGCPEGEFYADGCVYPEGGPAEFLPDLYRCAGDVHKYADWYACPGYRLPTSAEWEYAARGGATGSTWAGEITTTPENGCSDPVAYALMWYCGTTETMMPVGGKPKNPWGLYEVLGNAQEWTDYVFKGLPLDTTLGVEPPIVDPIGDGHGTFRDLRGGMYRDVACFARLGSQRGTWPEARGIDHGFRLARTLTGTDELGDDLGNGVCVWR